MGDRLAKGPRWTSLDRSPIEARLVPQRCDAASRRSGRIGPSPEGLGHGALPATLGSMDGATDSDCGWTIWPLRERPIAAIGLLLATAALAVLAGVIGGDLLWGLLAAFLVLVWLNGFLLPTRFEATAAGITAAGPLFTRKLAWRDATRFAVQSSGGWLGRAAGPRWRRRGLDLLWREGSDVPDRLIAMACASDAGIDVRDLRSIDARASRAPTPQRVSPDPASTSGGEPACEETAR